MLSFVSFLLERQTYFIQTVESAEEDWRQYGRSLVQLLAQKAC